MKYFLLIILAFCLFACQRLQESSPSLLNLLDSVESIAGKKEYLESPFVAAGDRLYVVGYQDGSFPDLGWHVQGEMGGIWDHPIKLMDGFTLWISNGSHYWCLSEADRFINYPVANHHDFRLDEGLEVTRVQFVPDGKEGLVVEYTVSNKGNKSQKLALEFTGMVDLRPVWLSDSLGITDGEDELEFIKGEQIWIARDPLNDWFTIFGSDQLVTRWQSQVVECTFDRKGKGKDANILSQITLAPGEKEVIKYFISGSYQSEEEAFFTYQDLKRNAEKLLQEKISRYRHIRKTVDINIPDSSLQELYTWTKYNTDWLIREVPELGRGLSAGIPDYPWWFGTDNGYALQGWLSTGRHEEVKATIELILKLSENGNGRIIHEASTNGVIYNPGNLNTTGRFIYLLWEYYKWTGDRSMLEKAYPIVKAGISWLTVEQDRDQNGYPDGAGMMEIHGLDSEMIDVAVYTQAGLAAAGRIAGELGDDKNSEKYTNKATQLIQRINSDWWVESANSFADFKATREQTLELIDAALVRADTLDKPWAVDELGTVRKQVRKILDTEAGGRVVHHNWVVNTPMEMGIADPGKAAKALEEARMYSNRFGMYVTGIDRDEHKAEASKWKAFSYVGAVMTLPTGVQAIGEANYGNPDEALEYLQKLTNSFSYALPGSMYEVSPDYGMFAQAWNIYAVAVPIIDHFFGIDPMAHEQKVIFQPELPSEWDSVSISDLVVGENRLTFKKEANTYTVIQSLPEWEIVLILPGEEPLITVNGAPYAAPMAEGFVRIELSGEKNSVKVNSTH